MTDLNGKSILVTGGTGSFGQRFVRRLFRNHRPRRVVIYSRDELKQFEMAQDLRYPELRYFIGDVRDLERLKRALANIDIIVHAAALKQVVAAEYNPIECIKTNVLGAENVINAAIDCGVELVIGLSTDKAVNPINLYGATKLCSDKLFVAANNLGAAGGTRFAIVRYGNVIGSRGSVVPYFRKCAENGEVTITDPGMTRFWITMEQGAAFVERSISLLRGGEILVPKLPSMRIVDLAAAIAPNCEQKVIGIRPGEKLHELMVPHDEARHTLEFDDYYLIQPDSAQWNYDPSPVYGEERGQPVAADFEYSSGTNNHWLSIDELRQALN